MRIMPEKEKTAGDDELQIALSNGWLTSGAWHRIPLSSPKLHTYFYLVRKTPGKTPMVLSGTQKRRANPEQGALSPARFCQAPLAGGGIRFVPPVQPA
jgi:hypothetical protein